MPRASDQMNATAAPLLHSFHPGLGYVVHEAPLPMPARPAAKMDVCLPRTGSVSGSRHALLAPGGKKRLVFVWTAQGQMWSRPGGNRLAWTAVYLAASGWRYGSPV